MTKLTIIYRANIDRDVRILVKQPPKAVPSRFMKLVRQIEKISK